MNSIALRLSSLALAALLSAPALAADEKPAAASATPAAATATPAAAPAKPAAASAKPDAARGQAISTQVCAACHTNDGSRGSPANPILQGQIPEYIVKQLHDFKSGERTSAIMKAFASALNDADMSNVAAFYSGKEAKPGFAKSKDSVQLGQSIWRGGIADRGVPACAGCHGPAGAGVPSQYPRLAGQHADYTTAQLTAFRAGARKNSPQMAGVSHEMNDNEIKAVADYIAGLR